MDVWRLAVAALRRWYIFLPLLALSAFAAFAVGNGVRPQYEVTATVILVPGTETSQIDNPYGGVGESGEVLTIILDGATARDQIEGRGLNREYDFRPRTLTRIMDFSVLSEVPEDGIATGEAVLDLAREELASSQEAVEIPEEAQMGLETLQAPSVTDVVSEGKLRSMVIAGILGAAVSLTLAVLVDDLLGLRKRRAVAGELGLERREASPVGLPDASDADDCLGPEGRSELVGVDADRSQEGGRERPSARRSPGEGARHREASTQDA